MPRITPFDRYPWIYDRWFDENPRIYQSEVRALEQFVPCAGRGLEVGVGTARFAAPLHIEYGVDVSPNMALIARKRNIESVVGAAEDLPFCDGSFDFAVMITVICFIRDPLSAFHEVYRVLRSDGALILAIIDRNSLLGRRYLQQKESSIFFREATFFTTEEVERMLERAGFTNRIVFQTVFEDLKDESSGFVIIQACKSSRGTALCERKVHRR